MYVPMVSNQAQADAPARTEPFRARVQCVWKPLLEAPRANLAIGNRIRHHNDPWHRPHGRRRHPLHVSNMAPPRLPHLWPDVNVLSTSHVRSFGLGIRSVSPVQVGLSGLHDQGESDDARQKGQRGVAKELARRHATHKRKDDQSHRGCETQGPWNAVQKNLPGRRSRPAAALLGGAGYLRPGSGPSRGTLARWH